MSDLLKSKGAASGPLDFSLSQRIETNQQKSKVGAIADNTKISGKSNSIWAQKNPVPTIIDENDN